VVVPAAGEAAVAVGSLVVTTDVVTVAGDTVVAGGDVELAVCDAAVELVCGGGVLGCEVVPLPNGFVY
jgi:hypothetical protein